MIVILLDTCLLFLFLTVRNKHYRVRNIDVAILQLFVIPLQLISVCHCIGWRDVDRVVEVGVVSMSNDGRSIGVVHVARLVECLSQLHLVRVSLSIYKHRLLSTVSLLCHIFVLPALRDDD